MGIIETLDRIEGLVIDKAKPAEIRSILIPFREQLEAIQAKASAYSGMNKKHSQLKKDYLALEMKLEAKHLTAMGEFKAAQLEEVATLKKGQANDIATLKAKNKECEHLLFLCKQKRGGGGHYNPLRV